MRAWLVAHCVDEGRLLIEDESTNTYENLRNSFALIGVGAKGARGTDAESGAGDGGEASKAGAKAAEMPRIAVVSSSYHLYRAKLIARGLGVDVAGIASYPGNPVVTLNYFIREAPAVWKQLLLGAR